LLLKYFSLKNEYDKVFDLFHFGKVMTSPSSINNTILSHRSAFSAFHSSSSSGRSYDPIPHTLTKRLSVDLCDTYQKINDRFNEKKAGETSLASLQEKNKKRKELHPSSDKTAQVFKRQIPRARSLPIMNRQKPLSQLKKEIQRIPIFTDYIFLKSIQEGRSAKVWEALNTRDGVTYAAKAFKKPDETAEHEYGILRELLNVPHALQCRALGRIHKTPVIIVEKMAYPDLYDYLQKSGPLSLHQTHLIALQGCEFLRDLKRKGIIDGDIKPENMSFDTETNRLVFYDFGISQKINKPSQLYSLVQTQFFRDPVVDLGYKQYDESIDMWSLGCVLFFLYTGTFLFPPTTNPNLYLQHVFATLGMPSADYLKKLKRVDTFFTRCELGFHWKHNLNVPSCDWKEKIRKKGEVNTQVEQFIDLISKMLRYEDRITPEKALEHPLFDDIAAFCVYVNDPPLQSHTLNIYQSRKNPPSLKTLSSIDLAAPQTALCCLHLPSSKHRYLFRIVEKGTQKVLLGKRMRLGYNNVFHVKRDKEQWTIVKKDSHN
jgi:casein kinase II subunit alpha